MNNKYSNEIKEIDINSPYYPENLRIINDPPECLYCIGDLNLLGLKSVAVIGSRKYTLYVWENCSPNDR